MADLILDQNYPGGVSKQLLDQFSSELDETGGWGCIGKITFNWGEAKGNKSPIKISFRKAYNKAPPIVVITDVNPPEATPSAISAVTKTGFNIMGTGTFHWIAIGS